MNKIHNIAISTLFIGYYDISVIRKAPQVRIYELSKAFKRMGCRHFIIGGRWSRAIDQIKWIFKVKKENIRYVYIENNATTAWPMDLLFIFFLRCFNVKIAIYIRDAYPYFSSFRKKLKYYQIPLYWGWIFSMNIFEHFSDLWFVQTKQFKTYLRKYHSIPMALLPPGTRQDAANLFNSNSKNLLYMGGISNRYGKVHLAQFSKILQEIHPEAKLNLLIRQCPKELSNIPNISIIQGNIDTLIKKSYQFCLGISFLEVSEYNKMTAAVKLYDYLSLGLPVISTPLPHNIEIINCYNIGFIVEDHPPKSAKLVNELMRNRKRLEECAGNIQQSKIDSWNDRAITVLSLFQRIHKHAGRALII